jgi:hypothetical protein
VTRIHGTVEESSEPAVDRLLLDRLAELDDELWRPWLFGIPRNRALDHLRSLKRDSAEPVLQKSVIRDYVAEVSGGTEGALRVQIHRPLRTLRDQIEGTR